MLLLGIDQAVEFLDRVFSQAQFDLQFGQPLFHDVPFNPRIVAVVVILRIPSAEVTNYNRPATDTRIA